MKKSGTIKKILVFALLLAFVFAFASCGAVETERGNEIKPKCEALINALIAKDAEAAYATFPKEMNKEEFLKNFPNLCKYVEGVETYELKQSGWKSGVDNGKSYYIATYAMTSNAGNFKVEITEVEGFDGIYNFRIVSDEDYKNATENYTGTLFKMKGANAFQWGMIIFSAACFAFVIFAFVDCVKKKMKYKALWAVLILLCAVVISVTVGDSGMNANFTMTAMLFSYSYLQIYAAGAAVFKLSLPVGAIAYFIFRKKFMEMAETEEKYKTAPEPETIEVASEGEAEAEPKENGDAEEKE